ncbi:unnamed protein product [Allacma fusca]|uniref:Ileal sodium/bile acid cotransporter n=1 Tax=Allacma fusca TaxID=39272 RepID=A0A8J2JMX9_9HEXA|nr:unnamed protein product [Allacma fusca]
MVRVRMCPLWPIHYVFMYLAVLGPIWLLSFEMIGAAAQVASKGSNWNVTYQPAKPDPILVDKDETIDVRLVNVAGIQLGPNDKLYVEYIVEDPNIAEVSTPVTEIPAESVVDTSFNITGNFLGYTKICPSINYFSAKDNRNTTEILTEEKDCLTIAVIRESTAIDKAFTYSVAGLVAIIYVNMGAALDMSTVRDTLKRPIGPTIGFLSQFMIMPLLSYAICKALIPRPDLQLGLFITGCSPGGGASNIWTLTLGGNLDLSITMTTISSIAAFAMMPLWILTLGKTIFDEADLTVPYSKIGTFAVTLVVPLIIGIIIRRFSTKFANILVKILKPFAVFLIIFIVVFAIYTNLYLFQLFTWQILIAGFLLPVLGYILGGGFALALKQSWRDTVAIAIETGVQNTGLAIFALRFSMPQPEADLTTALPVAVAIMTPLLPALLIVGDFFNDFNRPSGIKTYGSMK